MNLLADIFIFCLVVAVPMTDTVTLTEEKFLNGPLTNMQVVNDTLYIGGKNKIYALDKDLKKVSSASTCDSTMPECGNINKILLVNDTLKKLVSCGTGKNGICEVRRLSNLSYVETQSKNETGYYQYLVVSADLSRPAVGMLLNDGSFMIAVTFGSGIPVVEDSKSKIASYFYAITTRDVSTLTRDLDKTLKLEIVETDAYRLEDYIIYYKKGFQHSGYSYFITNQKKEVHDKSSMFESKLVRICQNDTTYSSYTDVVISCESGYNLVQDVVLISKRGKPYLIGIFTQGEDPEKASGNSVICGGSLDTIDEKIIEAKEDYSTNSCEDKDNTKRYLPNNDPRTDCTVALNITDLTCDTAIDNFKYVIGKRSYEMKILTQTLSFDGNLTSLHGSTMNSREVVLAGTSSGNFYMMNLNDTDALEVFDAQKSVENESIQAIHQVDDDTLYVMTTKKIEKYVTRNCSEFTTCQLVMKNRNPLCGWCVFEDRATRNSSKLCPQDEWLQSFGSCVKLDVDVKGVQVGSPDNIYVKIKALYLPYRQNGKDKYSCRFLDGQREIGMTEATRNNSTGNFSCRIPTNVSDHTEARLELVVNGVFLASTPFLYYKCDHYKRCGECVSTDGANCKWSLKEPECKNNEQDPFISSVVNCPSLENNAGLNFIPRNQTAEVKLKASNLTKLNDTQSKFWCYISEGGSTVYSTATEDFVNSIFTCSVKINSEKIAKKEVQVSIKYGRSKEDSKELDDKFENKVTVYDCSKLAEDCSQCKSLNTSRYNCSWCPNECRYGNVCADKCPALKISKIIPRDGPMQGNTLVTIYGTELGTEWSDIKSVAIDNVPCNHALDNSTRTGCLIQNEDFSKPVPKCILCRTGEVKEELNGPVVVTVNERISQGSVSFSYKNVSVSGISPRRGPKAGGTIITIHGENLGVGNRKWDVFLHTQFCIEPIVLPDLDLEETSGSFNIKCETPAYQFQTRQLNASYIRLRMDSRDCFTGDLKKPFSFLPNPDIIGASTDKGFLSGGTILTIKGKHLSNGNVGTVSSSYMNEHTIEYCETPGDEQMICKVPKAPSAVEKDLMEKINQKANRTKRSTCNDECIEVTVVVKIDGVKREFVVRYFRDPIINKSEDVLLYEKGEQQLILKGDGLTLVATKYDYNITIGLGQCTDIELNNTKLRCSPPNDQPAPIDPNNPFPEVNVKVGNIRVTAGYLKYMYKEEIEYLAVIVGAAGGGVLFIIVIILVIIILKWRKAGKKAREYEQNLSNMEMEIRRVAREEFLDMHTTMSSVNKKLVEQGFPYHGYQQFACNVMFSVDYLWTEPVMTDDERLKANKVMESLESLIYNKFFLVSVISTMEKEKRFFIKEKCNLAGNLCAVLMGKMDYLNEILKLLMTNLVQDSSSKKHKTLFRRCETITEKLLSNWISLCLYPHIKNHSGSPLYLLYMATQKTMESGPIDAVTNDSKYTLSEEKLLKNWSSQEGGSEDLKFEAKPLTLNLVVDNGEEIFKCKVLDCDTISQVKSKCLSQIYVNYPASQLGVGVNDLALEWHEGFGGVLKLRDEDNTSKRDGHWIRLNTLAHYTVKDDSNMALVDPHSIDNQEDYVNLAQISMDGDANGSMDSTEPLTPLTGHDEENPHHLKKWHLVKKEEESSKQGKSAIAELYLNRLFTTKQSIMEYIRPLFDVILDQDRCPPPTKFLFDFLDELGERYKVDSDTVHTWKSHSYAIRVWASLMKMPNLLFDVAIPTYVDDNLDIISQVFIESFSLASQKFTKDTPSQKLIFHHEMIQYRDRVKEFYKNVKVDSQNAEEFRLYLTDVNRLQQQTSFNKVSALYRFYKQLKPYLEDILENLSTSKESSALGLDKKLEQIITIMENEDDE